MTHCMGHRETLSGEVYRCTLEAYHGEYCQFTSQGQTGRYLVTWQNQERWFEDRADLDNFIDDQPNNGCTYLRYLHTSNMLRYLGSTTKKGVANIVA